MRLPPGYSLEAGGRGRLVLGRADGSAVCACVEEIREVVTPEVAATLDLSLTYGIWWFNRRRTETRQVSDMGPDGRRYRRRIKVTDKPRSEWIAVPVPDSGIPRKWVDATREATKDNRRPSANSDRVWELSGGMLFCDECGNRMSVHTSVNHWNGEGNRYFYYRCPKRQRPGLEACAHNTHYRAVERESRVWVFVSGLLRDPERLRAGLEEMIERERAGSRGGPEREIAMWLEKAAEAERKRSAFRTWPPRDSSPLTNCEPSSPAWRKRVAWRGPR